MEYCTERYAKFTDAELLKELVSAFEKYDGLKDNELQILEDHPNRDFWDDELNKEYEELVNDIIAAAMELRLICRYVKENR